MPFTIDHLDDGRILEWETGADGAVVTEHDDYTPRFYVAPRSPDVDIDLTNLRTVYERHSDVVATEVVPRRPGFRRGPASVAATRMSSLLTSAPSTESHRLLGRHASCPTTRLGISPASTSTSHESSGTVSRTM